MTWRESFADSFTQAVTERWYRFAPFRVDSRVWWDQPRDAYMAGLSMQIAASINLAKETFPG